MRRHSPFTIHHSRLPRLSSGGFTIVELMIATLTFSVILVVITQGIIYFSRSYYRGLNNSTTQTAAASVINTLTQAIQFSNAPKNIPPQGTSPGWICAGGQQFIYRLGEQLPSTNKVLYQFRVKSTSTCYTWEQLDGDGVNDDAAGIAAYNKGTELLQDEMRLVALNLDGPTSNGLYSMDIKVAYGDNDLLCAPTLGAGTGGCDRGAAPFTTDSDGDSDIIVHAEELKCRSDAGGQFCSVIGLSKTVLARSSSGN